jgi:hypothetical protein
MQVAVVAVDTLELLVVLEAQVVAEQAATVQE